MPLYEYECPKCQRLDEMLVKISDSSPKLCTCCQEPMNKLMSQTSFVLKGEGWYETDFKNKKPKTSASTQAPSQPKTQSTTTKPSKGSTQNP